MRFWTKVFKTNRMFLELSRLSTMRLSYGRRGIPNNLVISAGVRLSVTDSGKLSFGKSCALDRNITVLIRPRIFSALMISLLPVSVANFVMNQVKPH